MAQSLLCSWLQMNTHGRQKYWLCFVFTCLQWRHACGADVAEHCLFHIHMSHIKRGKHCVEPKQFSGLTRQDNRETPCELRYSFPVLPSVFTPASVNNLWRPWISQRHNSPTLLFTAWGHALQQTPPPAHVNDCWGPSGLQTYNKMMCGEMESTQPGSESLQKRGD